MTIPDFYRLTPRQGEAFLLKTLGKSYAEIGRHFGISRAAARQLLLRAKGRIVRVNGSTKKNTVTHVYQ